MLADADKWNELTDVAASLEPYNDPLLNSRKGYIAFLEKLYNSGVLNFTQQCRGRVGAFCVSKKSKVVDGVKVQRQRMVLDCRQTNLIFKPPPQTRLGSLASLSEAEIPCDVDLFLAGADIKDCFYAVNMDPALQEFFALRWDVSDAEVRAITKGKMQGFGSCNVPVIKVLPMGFSWSFYLVQQLHTQKALGALGLDEKHLFLEGQPAPSLEQHNICIMPYCDNLHSICTDSAVCQSAKDSMARALEEIGFELHEHMDAATEFETLGGVIDGKKGQVRPTAKRLWKIIYAFEYAAEHAVDGKTIQRLLGHSMVVSVLNRCGMSVFRKLYDFSTSSTSPRFLTASERDECLIFAGIAPLLIADLRKEWSSTITCSDASPTGFGICECQSTAGQAKQHGRWSERWRFKRLPADQWKPRQRSEGWDVLSDVRTIFGGLDGDENKDEYVANNLFPEIPDQLMQPSLWKTVKMGKWKYSAEHITLKEARSLLIAVRRLSRSSEHRGKKHLVLLDNLALVFAVTKGRAHAFDLLRVLQKIAAICLAVRISLKPRWVRSEVNVADGPSRGSILPGVGSSSRTQSVKPSDKSTSVCSAKNLPLKQAGQGREGAAVDQGQPQVQGGPSESQTPQREGEGKQAFPDRAEAQVSAASGVGRCREKGFNWKNDMSGVEECELRDTVPVQQLLQEVRGLLEGERHSLASVTKRGRHGVGRLHGHPVFGQTSSGRRRKDIGRSGVLPGWPERTSSSQSQSTEGLEEGDASAKQVAIASSDDVWHGHVDDPSRGAADGSSDHDSLRLIPSTRRSTLAPESQCAGASDSGRKAISHGERGGKRFRSRQARQSGCVRHFATTGQPQDLLARGFPVENSQEMQWSRRLAVRLHHGGLPEGVQDGGATVGCGQFASLSTKAWRCIRRSQQRFPRPPGRQKPRQVDDGPKCEKIRKDWQSAAAIDQTQGRQNGFLHLGRTKHGEGDARPAATPSGLTGSAWENIFNTSRRPKSFCLEIFAGSARISQMLQKEGLAVYPIDTCIFPSHNVLLPDIEHRISYYIRSGRVQLVWMGMPCTTFSRARRCDGLGPGPLRSDEHLWGLPDLIPSDNRKLQNGNELFLFTLRILQLCVSYKIPFVLENPLTSFAWEIPAFQRFYKTSNSQMRNLDFCMFGEDWKKPTRLVYNYIDLAPLSRRCCSSNHVCSRTSRPHVPLKGLAPNGKFWTLVAQPYPWCLAAEVASIVAKALRGWGAVTGSFWWHHLVMSGWSLFCEDCVLWQYHAAFKMKASGQNCWGTQRIH